MTFFNSVKSTVSTAVDTISTVAQTLVEKNRTNAKLNRLRLVMKNESELMNRAYIALGKYYYESQKSGTAATAAQQKKLFEVIETSKAKIAKARERYRQIIEEQNNIFYGVTAEAENRTTPEEIVDITVACSNENEYEASPFADKSPSDSTPDDTAEASEKNESGEADEMPDTDPADSPASEDDSVDEAEAPDEELF